jgi:hypothetical protein
MNKLLVFETDRDVREFLANNPILDNLSVGSIERGAGSIDVKMEKGEYFDLILFDRRKQLAYDLITYFKKVEEFIKDLEDYRLINDKTKFI